jgi:hypothetical protein
VIRSKKKIYVSGNLESSREISKGQHPKKGRGYGVKSTRAIVGSALKEQLGSGKIARKAISRERKINARRKRGSMK